MNNDTKMNLSDSEERYRMLFESIDEGFCLIEVLYDFQGKPFDHRILESNSCWEHNTGIKDPQGRLASELMPGVEQFWNELYAEVILTCQTVRKEVHSPAFGRWFDVLVSPVNPIGSYRVAVTYTDITDRKKSEELLLRSEKRFESIANLVPDLLWDSEPDGSTNWYNQRWLEYTGQKFDEAIGWGWVEAIHPDDREASASRYADAIETGRSLKQEHRIRRYDGEYRWFTVNISPLKNEKGDVVKVYGAATDIHERKTAEQILLESERRQAFLLRLANATRPLSDAAEIQGTAAKLLRERLDAGWCYYNEFDQAETISTVLVDDYRDGLHSMVGIHNLSNSPQFISSLRAGKIFQASDISTYSLFAPEVIEHYTALGMHSAIGVPLIKDGKLLAVLLVADNRIRQWNMEEIELVKEVAEGTWSAIVRALAEAKLKQVRSNYMLKLKQEVQDRTDELQRSRDSLQTIFDTTLVGMSVFVPIMDEYFEITDFRILTANKKVEDGAGRGDLTGKLYAELFPGIKQMGLFDLMVKTFLTGEPGQMEYHYNYEGIDQWYSTMFVKGEDKLVGTTMDITERIQAEADRFRNYLLLQQSEQIASLGSWDYHLVTGAFAWSEGMYRLFDLKNGVEIQPEIYLQYTTEGGREAAERVVDYIRSGKTDFEETLEMNVSGRTKILHIKAALVLNAEGSTERVLGVDMDISAMYAIEETIRKMEAEQQREIFRTSLSTLEQERHRISESLHNGIGQILFAVKLNLSGLKYEQLQDQFNSSKAYISELLKDAIVETRRISHELMPTTLEQFGLKSALDDICKQLSKETRFDCTVSGEGTNLEKYMELAIYRTTQELMINVVKHAGATICKVKVIIDSEQVRITVEDNGKGMPFDNQRIDGIGLTSILSKTKLLDGNVDISSTPGEGTYIEVVIPYQGSIKK